MLEETVGIIGIRICVDQSLIAADALEDAIAVNRHGAELVADAQRREPLLVGRREHGHREFAHADARCS